MNPIPLEGRTAVVFGACGILGDAAARTLAGRGARVVVGDPDAVDIVGGADAVCPDPDVLVLAPRRTAIDAGPAEEALHVSSYLEMIRRFAPAMVRRGRGSIIVAEPSALPLARGRGAASGGAVVHLVRRLASEMRPHGVRVNAIACRGEDPAAALAFLAGESSRHVTGALLAMERGWWTLDRPDDEPDPIRSWDSVIPFARRHVGTSHTMSRIPRLRAVHEKTTTNEDAAYEQRRA